jgi:hypothetical protein
VTDDPDAQETTAWQPTTSRPGEIFTVEGQIASTGAFARGLKNWAERGRSSRSSSKRPVVIVALGVVVVVLAAIVLL